MFTLEASHSSDGTQKQNEIVVHKNSSPSLAFPKVCLASQFFLRYILI